MEAAPLRRVLIADDSRVTRRVMAALISTIAPEAEIVEAADGHEAHEALANRSPDIAFIDMHMPRLSGPDAVARAREGGADPFVILMSDALDPTGEERARDVEAYELLQKPLEEHELRQIFANLERMRQPTRALVVDDSKAARRLILKVLKRSRFVLETDTVGGGEAALDALKKARHDVVFLDYDMPGIDGLETACLIQEAMPEVKVIMISASQNPAVEKAARYFGAVHFLRKPFYAREVDRAMHVALDLPRTSFMLEPVDHGRQRPAEAAPDVVQP